MRAVLRDLLRLPRRRVAGVVRDPLLDKGWAVAMPDFGGPKSGMAGPQGGQAVLDGIRAVQRFGTGGLGEWALNGYSGGAQATGWAAELQPSYAPDVLADVTMSGTPADPGAVARSLDGGLFSGFEAAVTVSLDAEFPGARRPEAPQRQGSAGHGGCARQVRDRPADRLRLQEARRLQHRPQPAVGAVGDGDAEEGHDGLGRARRTGLQLPREHRRDLVPVGQANALVNDVVAFLSDRFAGKFAATAC